MLLGTLLLENNYDIYCIDYVGYNYLQRNDSITKSGFGRSIRDTIYNCAELETLAKERRPELLERFQCLALYQARTFLIFMPKRYIKEDHSDYLFAMSILRRNKRQVWRGFYSKKDKLFLLLCLVNVKFAKHLVGER